MAGNAYLGMEYGLNYAVCSPGDHQVFVSVTRAKERKKLAENDEVAALKRLQFRSGSGQFRVYSTW